MRKLIVVLALCVISSLALVAQGTPPPDSTSDSTAQLLQQAHALYERLDLERAVPLLERVLSPGWSFGMTKAQRVDAYTYLAASLALVGSTDSAARYFRAALERDPFTDLDPRRFTPGQLAVFRNARRLTFAVGARQVSALLLDPRTEQLSFTVVTTHEATLRVEVRSVDVASSTWDCTLEPAVRLGLRMVKGLSRAAADRPDACNSTKNAVTATTGAPATSLNRYGCHTSPVSSTEPTLATTNAARSRSSTSPPAMDGDRSPSPDLSASPSRRTQE